MAEYKIDLSVLIEAQNPAEAKLKLKVLLAEYQLEIGTVEQIEDKSPVLVAETVVAAASGTPVAAPVTPVTPLAAPAMDVHKPEEPFVTYRVADEKFRVLARDFGLQGSELKVPRNREFLLFRVKDFLEELGYKVEPKTNIRVVAESHVETVPQVGEEPGKVAAHEVVYAKRV
ncbi:MAG TPA: hypothetical protein VNU93_02325 [Verrucomicrobiae bacterium]|nr:hypothetical protein [Verrucomicrobiae bacterium]